MMKPTTQCCNRIVDFEVAKHTLVVHTLPDDRQHRIANRPGAVRELLRTAIKHSCDGSLGRRLPGDSRWRVASR